MTRHPIPSSSWAWFCLPLHQDRKKILWGHRRFASTEKRTFENSELHAHQMPVDGQMDKNGTQPRPPSSATRRKATLTLLRRGRPS